MEWQERFARPHLFRPGRVREILDVPLARPRTLASLSDPAFNEMANYIRGQLFTRPVV